MKIELTDDFRPLLRMAKAYGLETDDCNSVVSCWAAYDECEFAKSERTGCKSAKSDQIGSKEFLGGVMLCKTGALYKLDLLCVRQDWQSKGLSRMLLKTVENDAKKRRAKKLYVIARKTGDYYRSLGFTTLAESKFPRAIQSCTGCVQKDMCNPEFLVKALK